MAYFRCIGGTGGSVQPLDIDAKIGSSGITLTDGRYLSGFTASAQGYYPLTQAGAVPSFNMANAWHIHFKVKASAEHASYYQCVYGAKEGYYRLPLLEFQKPSSANLFWAGWSENGTSNTRSLNIPKTAVPFVANQWYTIDEIWDGSGTVTLTVTDGTNTYTATQTGVAQWAQPSTATPALGGASGDPDVNVTYDLADCYWEQGGVILWGNRATT